MYTHIMAQECDWAHHSKLMVIHIVRLIECLFFESLVLALFLFVSLLLLALLFPLLPGVCPEPLLPCGQRQDN